MNTPENIENSNNSPLGDGSSKPFNMYYGASPALFEKSKELMANMTQAEEVFWNVIKINEWHLKFRRQHPISNYVVDFYCHAVKLVIELDGGYHEEEQVKRNDAVRQKNIEDFGITVLRFKNEEILFHLDKTIIKIDSAIHQIKKLTEKKAGSLNNSPLGDGGKLFIIKIGGNVIDDNGALQIFLKAFASAGAKKILVHGGGKIATKIGDQLGIESKYINGRRVTDEATIDLVTMVYGGLVNKKIVAALQSFNCNAIGLTGADANIIPAVKRPVKEIDYGFAGDIDTEKINTTVLEALLQQDITPVIAPLSHDGQGQMLNTNADTIASAIAVSLSKNYNVRLIYCFEKKGILENTDNEKSVIHLITKEKYKQLLADKKLFDGIIPKIDNAFAAVDSGVNEVLIGHADDLLQNLTQNTKGTLIK